MKRALLLTAALAMAATSTVAEAQGRRDGRGGRGEVHRDHHRGPYVKTFGWRRGQVLAPAYRAPRYVITDYRRYRLRPPPVGYRYYHSGNDILLTAIATGAIVSVFGGLLASPPPPPPPAYYGPPPPPPPPPAYYDAPEPDYAPEPEYAPPPVEDYGPPEYAPRQDRG